MILCALSGNLFPDQVFPVTFVILSTNQGLLVVYFRVNDHSLLHF